MTRRILAWALNHRKTVVVASFLVFFGSLGLGGMIGSAFFPDTDRGEFYLNITAPAGSSVEQTDKICQAVEDKLFKRAEVTSMLTTIGGENTAVSKAQIFVKMLKKDERDKDVKQIMDELRNELKIIPGTEFDFRIESGPGGDDKPITFSVRGEDLNKINTIAEQVKEAAKDVPGAVDVSSSLEASKPEVRVKIDRDKASDLGVNVYSIASSVRAMVDGYVSTKFQEGNEQYDVRVRLKESNRKSIADIQNLMIMSFNKGPHGEKINVRLGDIANVYEGTGPSIINRYNRQREIRIGANVTGRFMGEILADIQKETSKIKLPAGYDIKLIGEAEVQEESFLNIFISLILAIIFVYIILAMQFESFVLPFSIMLSLPMSIIGAVLALLVAGSAMSIISLIGIIMLMGLVTKNAILLVDYTNVLRERGHTRTEALLEAGPTRLRPILMTTLAMIFGMFPVAFGFGEGSEFRSPMGQAVIGGLITSTLLTLLIVPVVYTILDDFSMKKIGKAFSKVFSFGKKKEISLEAEPVSNK